MSLPFELVFVLLMTMLYQVQDIYLDRVREVL